MTNKKGSSGMFRDRVMKMHPANGNDAWGGFKLEPNGLEPYNEDMYRTRLRNEAFMELVYDTYESNHRRMFYRSEMQREVVRHINKSLNIKTQYRIQIESSENLYGDVMNHVRALGGNIWPPPGVPAQVPAQGVPEIPKALSDSVVSIHVPSVTPPPVVYINYEFDDEEDPIEPSESVGLPKRHLLDVSGRKMAKVEGLDDNGMNNNNMEVLLAIHDMASAIRETNQHNHEPHEGTENDQIMRIQGEFRKTRPSIFKEGSGKSKSNSCLYLPGRTSLSLVGICANLLLLDLLDYDVIFGMHLLKRFGAIIDCGKKLITMKTPDGKKFSFYGDTKVSKPDLILDKREVNYLDKLLI
ncbi:hypothetical protein DVH24_009784 [Malus domestica]|uniref:Uncharacterized protein n=1 Tax=Malus domestica TaxID=3750 RepID=A0A498KRT5_MALDO|nr:hypothetical protein DVH24_009784 [Malus domestica]